jgi:hypothetical protein
MAIDGNLAVQDVPYEKLRARLIADGQVLESGKASAHVSVPAAALEGIVVDDADAKKTGSWRQSHATPSFVGDGYSVVAPSDSGDAVYALPVSKPGRYELRLSYAAHENRAGRVAIDIAHAGGTATKTINQQQTPPIDGLFVSLGNYRLEPSKPATVTIHGSGAGGYVVADAIQALPVN